MTHYDDESLFQYAEGSSPIAQEIESHVSACGDCATEVGGHREMVGALRSGDVWDTTVEPAAPRQFVVDVVAFAERVRAEDERAVALCDQILTGPSSWWSTRLRQAEGAYTAGVVKQLLERMRQTLESAPTSALQITAMAIEVANELDVIGYPCDYAVKLRAQAYRDHAYVLSFLGRAPEALDYVNRSQRLFDQVPLPEYDLARLALVRAAIYHQMDRLPESIKLVREAAATFLRFGDRSRYLGAKVHEGAMLYHSRDFRAALALWQSIEADPAVDSITHVRLVHNIALCHIELGQPELAAHHLQRSIAEFDMLGMATERSRSRWSLGSTLVSTGRNREAIPLFRQVWREFESLGMDSDAALAALELAEQLLLAGDASEVPGICRDLVARFTRNGMASRAITALSFLREAVAIGQATPSLVRHVRTFLRELPAEQPCLFAPAPAGREE